ncbi:ethanolamine ammonia-lyase [Paenibacillus helianthi]|uniref:Ethanolamine ammonia-lyase small subunit n=1 Tax=Paenibacillus helianthi TaxID=1349432 RepID=A0ABX3EZ54_9BACL|nr:ethanolamine ammonia-lyase subunit EutC [Paenibacillus helianthi]OKP92023.1 ethanolamine ammonia-lyase [Paenibacillus helianthi]
MPFRDEDRMQELKQATPARIGTGRAGTRPTTRELLKLRYDHAAAVDSVYGSVSTDLLAELGLFMVDSGAVDQELYLRRPDLGRLLPDHSIQQLIQRCIPSPQVQLVVSDGLSAGAIEHNAGDLIPALLDSLQVQGLKAGTPFFVRNGRVGIMNTIGDILHPETIVLLIGERPGLITSHSMSAYLCYRPCAGMTDSDRMVISNIHQGGTPPVEAGAHIGSLIARMLKQKKSGVGLVQ